MSNTILEFTYSNRPYDTTDPSWPSALFHGNQFVRNDTPIWEWTPVLHPTSELEDPLVGLAGTAVRPRLSHEGSTGDLPFTHMFGNDWTVDVALDPSYRSLLALGNTNGDQPRQDPDVLDSIAIAQDVLQIDPATNFGEQVKGVIHCEIDRGLVPHHLRTQQGDRIGMLGRWVVDTGHNDPYGAEIHPPLLIASARPVSPSETYATFVCRPFLDSQNFGSSGLLSLIHSEILAVELNPFKARIELKPNPPYGTPFAGAVLALFTIRPPKPRTGSRDVLTVTFHFTVRPSVAVQVGGGTDSLTVGIALNDAQYVAAPLPPRHDRYVNPDDLAKAQPDVGGEIQSLEAASLINAWKPWAGAVFKADILTDAYDPPQALSVHDSEIQTTTSGGTQYSEDSSQPFPLYGWLSVRWQGQPLAEWQAWTEIAGNGVTNAALTGTNFGGWLYVFHKGMDGHIYFNVMDEASPSGTWGSWTEVPGGGTTDAALAAEVGPDDKVYLFAKGIGDKQVYVNVMDSTQVWTGWKSVPGGGTTDARLSATLFGRKLFLFAKGINDRRIYVDVMSLDGTWSGWREVPGGGTTDAGLASVAGPDGKLHLFGKGINDRRVYQNTMTADAMWSGWQEVPGGGTTDVALGAVRYGSRVFLLGKGINDHGTYLNTMEATGSWSGWSGIPGQATTLDSLSGSEGPNGTLYLFRVGQDQRLFFLANKRA